MKRWLISLLLLLTTSAWAGDSTTNSYFYLPSVGASGASERTTWFNALEATDAVIEANKDAVANEAGLESSLSDVSNVIIETEIDSKAKLEAIAGEALGGSLDASYDVGATITADNGPVDINGNLVVTDVSVEGTLTILEGVLSDSTIVSADIKDDTIVAADISSFDLDDAYDDGATITADNGPVVIENTGGTFGFRVNDETSDTTPFVIDEDGYVGIGTTAPTSALTILSGGDITFDGASGDNRTIFQSDGADDVNNIIIQGDKAGEVVLQTVGLTPTNDYCAKWTDGILTAGECPSPTGGDVTGPAGGTVAGHVALFSSSTGKAIRTADPGYPMTVDISNGNAAISGTLTVTGAVSSGSVGGSVFNINNEATGDFTWHGDNYNQMIFGDASADIVYLGGASGVSVTASGTMSIPDDLTVLGDIDGSISVDDGEYAFYATVDNDAGLIFDVATVSVQMLTTDSSTAHAFQGGGSHIMKEQASPATDTAGYGQLWVKSDTPNAIYFTDDAGTSTALGIYEKSFTLESPTADDDDVPIWHPRAPITITDVYCEVEGGTSAEITISDGSNDLETITCDLDGQADDGSIANGIFDADERMEFDTGTVTGTVDWVSVSITYTGTVD